MEKDTNRAAMVVLAATLYFLAIACTVAAAAIQSGAIDALVVAALGFIVPAWFTIIWLSENTQ